MITPSSMNGDTPLQLPAVPGAETSLDDLAVFIDTQYDLAMVEADAAMAKATDTLRRALVVGAALIEAKSRLKHGEWGPWLQENTHVPARTARKWMRLAHNRTELSNRPLTADLGIEEALKLLASPKKQVAGATPDPDYLDIDEIELDPVTSTMRDYRSEGCLSTVRRYIRLYELLPPPVVYQVEDGSYVLADGHLRLLAAQRLGYSRVRVELRQGTRIDAADHFDRANLQSGMEPTLEEIQRYYVQHAAGRSPEEMAAAWGIPVDLARQLPTLETW